MLRKKAKAEVYLAKQAALSTGVDLERQNNLTYTIEETIRWNEQQEEKEARQDPSFTDYAQMGRRKYGRLLDKLDPQVVTRRTSEEAKEALAEGVKEEQRQRQKYSRRRKFDASEDVTYINERNAQFNKKVSRAFDEYTQDLRQE